MEDLMNLLQKELAGAFAAAGYDESLAVVTVSNRPDLCEFQCNGAMAGAKLHHKAPAMIAKDVAEKLAGSSVFSEVSVAGPGFINLKVSGEYLADWLRQMSADPDLAVQKEKSPRTVIVDYGGANVAKPLHVGHLRSAIIGESLKRIIRFMGNRTIGDVHLGDWGLQMGLIIAMLEERKPDLVYFDPDFAGEYPQEAPFTISDLEEIYPAASKRSKEDEEFREKALRATHELQRGRAGYMALWRHIMNVSVTDLRKNYGKLGVTFDLWKGESDAQPYIPDMVESLKEKGIAYEDQGALIVDVKEENDTREVPPCIILKSDGASLYATTDLATMVERVKDYDPDEMLYLTDKRQEMHFVQVFRTAKKAGIVSEDTRLRFLGFGTMNGKDGHAFKTRDGGVMRLETLISDINEEMYRKIMDNHEIDPEEARKTAEIVGLAAIKYGDLSNQASKDYIFDPDRFTSFEGNTGPYILYTIVRIKSILTRYTQENGDIASCRLAEPTGTGEKDLMLALTRFGSAVDGAYREIAPHRICSYIYDLANAFNRFYHETRIMTEKDETQKASWIALLELTRRVLETAIDLLGFAAPEKM